MPSPYPFPDFSFTDAPSQYMRSRIAGEKAGVDIAQSKMKLKDVMEEREYREGLADFYKQKKKADPGASIHDAGEEYALSKGRSDKAIEHRKQKAEEQKAAHDKIVGMADAISKLHAIGGKDALKQFAPMIEAQYPEFKGFDPEKYSAGPDFDTYEVDDPNNPGQKMGVMIYDKNSKKMQFVPADKADEVLNEYRKAQTDKLRKDIELADSKHEMERRKAQSAADLAAARAAQAQATAARQAAEASIKKNNIEMVNSELETRFLEVIHPDAIKGLNLDPGKAPSGKVFFGVLNPMQQKAFNWIKERAQQLVADGKVPPAQAVSQAVSSYWAEGPGKGVRPGGGSSKQTKEDSVHEWVRDPRTGKLTRK